MIALGFILGAALASPVFFTLGCIFERDRRITHEPADIRPALRRSR